MRGLRNTARIDRSLETSNPEDALSIMSELGDHGSNGDELGKDKGKGEGCPLHTQSFLGWT